MWMTHRTRLVNIAQCQTSTQELTDRYLVDFGFEGVIWATVTRKKKIFAHLVTKKLEKIWCKVGIIALLFSDFDHVQDHSYYAHICQDGNCFETPWDL